MKREKALQIATNFYTFRMGSEPVSMTVKYEDPKDGRVVLVAADHDIEEDEEVLYEIEINPATDSITMKKILCEFSAKHFMQGTKRISELCQGVSSACLGIALYMSSAGLNFGLAARDIWSGRQPAAEPSGSPRTLRFGPANNTAQWQSRK